MLDIIGRIVDATRAVLKGEVGPLKDDRRIWTPLRLLLAGQGVTEPYRQHAAVYACVTAIATNISQVPFNLYRGKGDGKEIVEDGPLYKVLTNPNPLLSAGQLWEATAIHYALRGEACWILDRENIGQVPEVIWIFPSDRFKQILDRDTGFPVGWTYRRGATEIPLRLDQVIFFRAYNPYNDLRGMGPLEAASLGVEQDHWAARHNLAFFRNAAEPGGVLTTEQTLTDPQAEAIRKRWEDRHGGPDNANRIAVLEGGLKYEKVTLSPKDMEFLEQRRWNREEIAMVFRVPMHILSVYKDIKAYKGMLALDKGFWTQNLIPKMSYFEGMLFSKVFSFIDNGRVWGEFDLSVVEALGEDFNEKVDTAKTMNEMGWPINAINERLNMGMKPVPWGDTVLVPFSMVPADSLVSGTATPPEKGGGAGKGIIDEARKDIIWKVYVRLLQPHEDRMAAKVRRFFFEQRKRVLDALHVLLGKGIPGKKRDYTDDVFDKTREDDLLKVLAEPLFTDGVQAGIDAVETELALEDFTFTAGDPAAAKYIEGKVIKITQINDTIREQIRKAINEGLTAGDTVKELADRIRGVYNFASARASTIARTESGSCIQGGKFLARKEVNVDHTWLTARDEYVRASHAAQDGVTVPIGERFPNGLQFPNDPTGAAGEIINCRCDTVSAT